MRPPRAHRLDVPSPRFPTFGPFSSSGWFASSGRLLHEERQIPAPPGRVARVAEAAPIAPCMVAAEFDDEPALDVPFGTSDGARIVIHSAGHTHTADFRTEVWAEQPPPPTDPWDERAETRIDSPLRKAAAVDLCRHDRGRSRSRFARQKVARPGPGTRQGPGARTGRVGCASWRRAVHGTVLAHVTATRRACRPGPRLPARKKGRGAVRAYRATPFQKDRPGLSGPGSCPRRSCPRPTPAAASRGARIRWR